MGNRAIVAFHDGKQIGPQVYLHWNGGPESVYAFLEEMERRKIRGSCDTSYATARFIHIVGDFFDSDEATGCSLGVFNSPRSLKKFRTDAGKHSQGDNGIFLISGRAGEWTVERFVGFDDGRWLTPDDVAREKTEALSHRYNANFRDTFTTLRPKISVYG